MALRYQEMFRRGIENFSLQDKLIPDVISAFLTLCLLTVYSIPKTKNNRNDEGKHVTWPDPDNDPLMYIANPIEAEVPGHWIPLSVLKHIVEKKQSTPPKTVLKPEDIQISHEIKSLENKTTEELKVHDSSTSNSSEYVEEVNTEVSNEGKHTDKPKDTNKPEDTDEGEDTKNSTEDQKNTTENEDDSNETQTTDDAGVTDATTGGDDDNGNDTGGDDTNGNENEQETTTADDNGGSDNKNTDGQQVDTTGEEATTVTETEAVTKKRTRRRRKPGDSHENFPM